MPHRVNSKFSAIFLLNWNVLLFLQPLWSHSSMDRISDSGSDDMGSNPVGITKNRDFIRNDGIPFYLYIMIVLLHLYPPLVKTGKAYNFQGRVISNFDNTFQLLCGILLRFD